MSTHAKSSPSAPVDEPKSSHTKWWLLLLLVSAVAGGGAFLWNRDHESKHSDAEGGGSSTTPSSEEGVRVEVVRPRRGGLTRTCTQIGSVHPFEYATLYAKVSGYLRWQEVDIGSQVKKGDLLATIDDPEVVKQADRDAAALTQAKAMVGQAKARVETASANEKAAASMVEKAQADVAAYISKRKYREKELARYRDLRAREAVPQQIVDEYEDHFETALAEQRAAEVAVISTKAQLDAAKAQVDQAKADLAEAISNVDVASATLAKARVLVDYTKIISPYNGVVTLRNFHVGDFIRSAADGNERPLLTVARTDKMRVVTYVPDRDVPYTEVGDKAIINLDALPGMKFDGKVARFSFSEEAQSRTMRAEVDLENPKGLLREGMYGIATIILEADTPNLTIPSGCLTGKAQDGKSSVFIVKAGKAHEVPVTIGTDDGIRVEIIKGLSADDEVISSRGAVVESTPVIIDTTHKVASTGTTPR